MAIIANILLFIASICIVGLNTGALSKPSPTGDAGVGYVWTLLMINIVFCIAMIIVAIITNSKGGYNWVPGSGTSRTVLVIAGVLSALIISIIGSLFRNEMGETPLIVKMLISIAPWIIPIILIIGHFILVNTGIRDSIPEGVYMWPLSIVGGLSILSSVLMIGAFLFQSNIQYAANVDKIVQDDVENQQRLKDDIDSCDISTGMVFILVLTNAYQQADVRERAIAKVKTHPDYQGELIRILQTGYASEAFQFLASNDVDDTKRFPEAVIVGITKQTEAFRETIKSTYSASDYYPELFQSESECVVKTADKFKGLGVDFKPAITDLRKAINGRPDIKRPELISEQILDKWLKNN